MKMGMKMQDKQCVLTVQLESSKVLKKTLLLFLHHQLLLLFLPPFSCEMFMHPVRKVHAGFSLVAGDITLLFILIPSIFIASRSSRVSLSLSLSLSLSPLFNFCLSLSFLRETLQEEKTSCSFLFIDH